MNLIELARTLIDIPSVTGSEGPLADYLTGYLKSSGLSVREQSVDGERRNLLASSRAKPKVILCTHMDTVPPFFPSSEEGPFLYGRGACDAKGILAAMIVAGEELREEGVPGVGLLFVVGEETDSIGAKMAPAISPGPDFIIVGEPTGNRLGAAHKGTLTVKITTKGIRSHSSTADRGDSAVNSLLDILEALRKLDFGGDPVLGETTLNIGLISGGTAPNVTADRAEATISLRLVRPPGEILEVVRSAARGRSAGIDILTQSPPLRLHAVPGYDPVVLPFSTDAPYLEGYGKPLLIGPGSVRDAHTERERVDKGELHAAVGIYKDLVKKLQDRD